MKTEKSSRPQLLRTVALKLGALADGSWVRLQHRLCPTVWKFLPQPRPIRLPPAEDRKRTKCRPSPSLGNQAPVVNAQHDIGMAIVVPVPRVVKLGLVGNGLQSNCAGAGDWMVSSGQDSGGSP